MVEIAATIFVALAGTCIAALILGLLFHGLIARLVDWGQS